MLRAIELQSSSKDNSIQSLMGITWGSGLMALRIPKVRVPHALRAP